MTKQRDPHAVEFDKLLASRVRLEDTIETQPADLEISPISADELDRRRLLTDPGYGPRLHPES